MWNEWLRVAETIPGVLVLGSEATSIADVLKQDLPAPVFGLEGHVGEDPPLQDPPVQSRLLGEINSGRYWMLFLSYPCSSYSRAHRAAQDEKEPSMENPRRTQDDMLVAFFLDLLEKASKRSLQIVFLIGANSILMRRQSLVREF